MPSLQVVKVRKSPRRAFPGGSVPGQNQMKQTHPRTLGSYRSWLVSP